MPGFPCRNVRRKNRRSHALPRAQVVPTRRSEIAPVTKEAGHQVGLYSIARRTVRPAIGGSITDSPQAKASSVFSRSVVAPPITTTCLAAFEDVRRAIDGSLETLHCCRHEIHREVTAASSCRGSAGHAELRRRRSAPRIRCQELLGSIVPGGVCRDIGAIVKVTPSASICATRRSMTCFSSLKSGSRKRSARRLGPALEQMHVVTGTRELLRAGHSRRTERSPGDLLAGFAVGVSA